MDARYRSEAKWSGVSISTDTATSFHTMGKLPRSVDLSSLWTLHSQLFSGSVWRQAPRTDYVQPGGICFRPSQVLWPGYHLLCIPGYLDAAPGRPRDPGVPVNTIPGMVELLPGAHPTDGLHGLRPRPAAAIL